MITVGKIIVNSMMNLVRKRAQTIDAGQFSQIGEIHNKLKKRRNSDIEDKNVPDDVLPQKRARRETIRYQAIDFIQSNKRSNKRGTTPKRPSPKRLRKSPIPIQGQKPSRRGQKKDVESKLKNLDVKKLNIGNNAGHLTKDAINDFTQSFNGIGINHQRLFPRANSIVTDDFDLARVNFDGSVKCFKSTDHFYLMTIKDANSGISSLKVKASSTTKNLVS